MFKLINATIILVSLVLVRAVTCYNILVIFGHPGKSHYDVFKPLFQELGERGHNITIISHVETEGDIKNGKDVLLSRQPLTNFLDLSMFPGNRLQKYMETHLIAYFGNIVYPSALQSAELQQFLLEDHNFDVILTEFFNTNCFFGLITKYKAPFIGLSSCSMMAWHSQWFGSPVNPSYIPSIYMAHPVPMTFLHRAENTLMHLVGVAWYKLFMERPGRELSLKYTGYEPADPYDASLLLLNTHYSLHGPRPLTPSIVEVGGIHVASKKPKRLPKDLEKWTNDSTSGLIYFSLGSLAKGHTFPQPQLASFLKVFSKRPERVLWKWEIDSMESKPENVMLTKWAPQFDVLCHPNTKLFISHGGLLGTTEAVHCGVPMLVMPQFGDQNLNAEAVKSHEAGVILNLREVTEEKISQALDMALSKRTTQNARKLSERFRDREVPPIQTAVYWIEHIARNKGGQHMRSAAIGMPFYQYFLLDVILFYSLIVFIFVFVIYRTCKKAVSLCVGSGKEKIS
ncbi:UDP-glycosyltransferase UGT5-like isoform X2 [Euwallacea similis]|uniref:UDP-glycosyltransferase UGT5-like isoform X2 n=1 Tax=Euwallacea similis TaxID=1736056 RepID=UPI00344BF252